jgi:hypothetical protein
VSVLWHQIALAVAIATALQILSRTALQAWWLFPDWCEKLVRLGYEIRRFRRSR